MKRIYSILFLTILCSCSEELDDKETSNLKAPLPQKNRPISVENGKIFEQNGTKMLFGGNDSSDHFDLSNCILKDNQFHYGIGREKFPALLTPTFTDVEHADSMWDDTARFLVAHLGDEVKAYSIQDLTRHEVVNDSINGKPIMAAYCILANLGAIYERKYGDKVLTFGLSGYTYYDSSVWDGLDGFVLWDRETESLWWPLIGKAVSGQLNEVPLVEMDEDNWEDTSWKTIKKKYPKAKIMNSNQDFERPKSWSKYDDVSDIRNKFIQ